MTTSLRLILLATAMVSSAAFAADPMAPASASAPATDTSVTPAAPQTMKACMAQQQAKDSRQSKAAMKKACKDEMAMGSTNTAPTSDYSAPQK